MTKENALHSRDPGVVYAAAKKFAELAVWEWAEAHPHVDVTTSKSTILVSFQISLKNICLSLDSPSPFPLRSITTQISSTSEARI